MRCHLRQTTAPRSGGSTYQQLGLLQLGDIPPFQGCQKNSTPVPKVCRFCNVGDCYLMAALRCTSGEWRPEAPCRRSFGDKIVSRHKIAPNSERLTRTMSQTVPPSRAVAILMIVAVLAHHADCGTRTRVGIAQRSGSCYANHGAQPAPVRQNLPGLRCCTSVRCGNGPLTPSFARLGNDFFVRMSRSKKHQPRQSAGQRRLSCLPSRKSQDRPAYVAPVWPLRRHGAVGQPLMAIAAPID
jgi:hypothetical protein